MLPFGSESFGQWFFGHGNWARRVLWENVPFKHRERDTDGHLERLLKAYGDSIEEFRRDIRSLPDQREPYLVRASEGEGEWFYVTEIIEAEDEVYGKYLRLVGQKDFDEMPNTGGSLAEPPDEPTWPTWFPWYPYVPAHQVGPGWFMQWDEIKYEVVAARLRNFDPRSPVDLYDSDVSLANEVWIKRGDTYPFKFSHEGVVIGTGDGTASPAVELPNVPIWLKENQTPTPAPWLTSYATLAIDVELDLGGSTTLYDVPSVPSDGTGALWPEDPLNPGEIDVGLPGSEWGTVDYRSGRIELSLQGDVAKWFSSIEARFQVKGFFFDFRPYRVIDHLARDFGFENDLNDPEFVQRSTIANITKYFGQKSTWDSYRIRGEISGFKVNAQALYYVCNCDLIADFPGDHVFYYDGDCYTDLPPRYVRFDDISADARYYRWESSLSWMIPPSWVDPPDSVPWRMLVDNALMYEDGSADGYSDALAFGLDVVQGYYLEAPWNPPAYVKGVYELDPSNVSDAAVLSAYGLSSAWRLEIQLNNPQKGVFNFRKGVFGITEYEGTNSSGGTPPSLEDPVWWIDAEDEVSTGLPNGYDPATSTWTVLVSSASAPAVHDPLLGNHIAIRYYPEIWHDCCYCRSYKMRVEIEPSPDSPSAFDYYDLGVDMQAAIERLVEKIKRTLVPIHVRIVEFAVQFHDCVEVPQFEITDCSTEIENVSVASFCYYYDWVGEEADAIETDSCAATVLCDELVINEYVDGGCAGGVALNVVSWFADPSVTIIMDIDQQGNYAPPGASQNLELRDQSFAIVWAMGGVASGVVAPGWGNVVSGVDVTGLIAGNDPATIRVSGSASLPCPATTRFTFTIT